MTPEQVKELVERLENGEDDFYCDPTDSMERHWPAIDARFREAASALSLLAQRVQKLEERLEITHCWASDEARNELVMQEIPPDERDSFPDGIQSRDATIELLENRLSLLAQEREELREALKPFVNAFMARRDTYIRRYGVDEELGARRFDAMPDAWEMEGLTFCMGRYRRARAALKDT